MKKKENKFSLFTKGSIDYVIFIVVMILLATGIIMVLSASAPTSVSETGSSYKYVNKQALSAGAGLVAMFVLSTINYKIYRKLKWPIYGALIGLLVLVGISGMGAGGARRWINIAGFNFQPSEIAKIGFIIFYASLLSDIKEKNKIKSIIYGCWLPLIGLLPIIYSIYVLQNHFSATAIICSVTIIQMFIAGTRITHFIITAFAAVPFAAVYLIYKKGNNTAEETPGFRSQRIQTWLNPFADPTGEGWQIINSLYAIGSGGIFGVGLGESKQKYLYLPEPQNDFIFSVLAEELGFVGCIFIIMLFIIFIWRGIVIATKAEDNFGCLVAIGIVSMIGLQAIINIAVVTGTIPVTGMPLPFFSYGGTAIMANLAAVGILLNIAKQGNK